MYKRQSNRRQDVALSLCSDIKEYICRQDSRVDDVNVDVIEKGESTSFMMNIIIVVFIRFEDQDHELRLTSTLNPINKRMRVA